MSVHEIKRGQSVRVTNPYSFDMSAERYGEPYPNPRYLEVGIVRDLYDRMGDACLADVEFRDGAIEPYPSEVLEFGGSARSGSAR